jgi:GT2 family glycosyltransferase
MYYEDIDLCIRMKRAGYEIWYEPKAIMWHDIPDGARAKASEFWRWRLKSNSMGLFHRKYFGNTWGFFFDSATLIIENIGLIKTGHTKAALHRTMAWFSTWFGPKTAS